MNSLVGKRAVINRHKTTNGMLRTTAATVICALALTASFSNHGVRLVSAEAADAADHPAAEAADAADAAAEAADADYHKRRHIWSSWRYCYRWLHWLCCCSGGL